VFRTGDAPTVELPLDEVLARLASHPAVDAILVMGSAGVEAGGQGSASDYDLLVVLAELPLPLRLVLTLVDRRLTEIYFASASTLERLAAGERLPDGAEELRPAMTDWIQTGRIAFNRSGRLEQTSQRMGEGSVRDGRAMEVALVIPRLLNGPARCCKAAGSRRGRATSELTLRGECSAGNPGRARFQLVGPTPGTSR
jgi:hypothetical protein